VTTSSEFTQGAVKNRFVPEVIAAAKTSDVAPEHNHENSNEVSGGGKMSGPILRLVALSDQSRRMVATPLMARM
jgi:hypothetical protein